jgi:hypothetical protein
MSPPRPTAIKAPRIFHALSVMSDSTTVAGVGPDWAFAYSDADWIKIKRSLARVDIDADAVTVGDRWWAQPYPAKALAAAPYRPLHEQLQELAADYRGLSRWRKEGCSLTPKQEAAKVQKVLDAFEHARLTLNSSRVGFMSYGADAGDIRKAMSVFTAKAERWRNGLLRQGNRSSTNARKVHIEYWGELVVLWRAITAGQAPRVLSHFMYACSAPVFPAETSQGSIRRFLDRLHQTSV